MTKKSKQVTPAGVTVWPNITKEGEYQGKPTGKFDCRLRLDPSDPGHAEFIDRINSETSERVETYLDNLQKSDKKAYNIQKKWEQRSPFTEELDQEGEETGMLTIKFTRSVDKGRPLVVDSKRKTIKKVPNITGGSTVKIAFATGKPYAMASGKFLGVPMYMNAVQLLALGSFGGGADDFDEEEGFEYDEDAFETDESVDTEDDEDEDDDF